MSNFHTLEIVDRASKTQLQGDDVCITFIHDQTEKHVIRKQDIHLEIKLCWQVWKKIYDFCEFHDEDKFAN